MTRLSRFPVSDSLRLRVRHSCSSVLLVASLLGSVAANAQELFIDPQFDVRVTEAIFYGTGTARSFGIAYERNLYLDLYEPMGPNVPDSLPGILLLHGGFNGSSTRATPGGTATVIASLLAERGYVAVSIDRRQISHEPVVAAEYDELIAAGLAEGFKPENVNAGVASIEDALTAHSYLVDNATSLRLDTSRIVLGGGSAGGIVALWWAYAADDFGLTELPPLPAIFSQAGTAMVRGAETIEAGEPPMFLVNERFNPVHSFDMALARVAEARSVGIPVEFHLTPYDSGDIAQFFDEISPGVTIVDRLAEFLYFHLFVSPRLDIKPGSDLNPINPMSRGVIPVAILGSDTFDVAEVDVATLAFGPGGAAPAHNVGGHQTDVNDDGFIDLVSHYRTRETGIAFGETAACVTGETIDVISFQDCDEILVRGGCGLGFELALLLPGLMWMRQKRHYAAVVASGRRTQSC